MSKDIKSISRGAGVAIPIFSLRSCNSMGVGDFEDIKLMVDWAVQAGQQVIQILPINDTTMSHTWEDSYPYNANSIFALHPQYLSLKRAGELQNSALQSQFESEGQSLNALPEIDYVKVNDLKERYMRQLYAEQGEELTSTKEFKKFVKSNASWLQPYALYCLLRDKFRTIDFAQWGEGEKYSERLLKKYNTPKSKDYKVLVYYYFVQYHLHIQLLEARDYAHQRGVFFKGDIPIGVSSTSVDVWCEPHLFNTTSQTGAPPDDFSILGQNWGFPTYNWAAMAKDGYAWWTARFRNMAQYFDAYRIDHILGFFRIWEIPQSASHGLLGHFSPALPLSAQEIETWGFQFNEEYLVPDINDWLLDEYFGSEAESVKSKYLNPKGRTYTFKRKYDTQQKILAHVEEGDLRDKLMLLFSEVLFVQDPRQKKHYHPRILAQHSYKFRAMSDDDKRCFNALYDDFYFHRHNDFWYAEAMRKLPVLISSTPMLTCGEDLGMIPACVEDVMNELKILSLEIQRMPKEFGVSFGSPERYKPLSVCTTSTHDMTPIRAWMMEDEGLSTRYASQVLGCNDYCAATDPAPEICKKIVESHLTSPAMWTILPLQDWLSIDKDLRCQDPQSDRINIPAKSRHYWRWRMHLNLETLVSAHEFNACVKSMVSSSDRV